MPFRAADVAGSISCVVARVRYALTARLRLAAPLKHEVSWNPRCGFQPLFRPDNAMAKLAKDMALSGVSLARLTRLENALHFLSRQLYTLYPCVEYADAI